MWIEAPRFRSKTTTAPSDGDARKEHTVQEKVQAKRTMHSFFSSWKAECVVFNSKSVVSKEMSPVGEIARIRSGRPSQSYSPATRCGTCSPVITGHSFGSQRFIVQLTSTAWCWLLEVEEEPSASRREGSSLHFQIVFPRCAESRSEDDEITAKVVWIDFEGKFKGAQANEVEGPSVCEIIGWRVAIFRLSSTSTKRDIRKAGLHIRPLHESHPIGQQHSQTRPS